MLFSKGGDSVSLNVTMWDILNLQCGHFLNLNLFQEEMAAR